MSAQSCQPNEGRWSQLGVSACVPISDSIRLALMTRGLCDRQNMKQHPQHEKNNRISNMRFVHYPANY